MSYIIRSGNTFRVVAENSIEVFDTLPVGNYTAKQDQVTKDFYLEPVDNFVMPPKFYGDTLKTANRILNTFNQRPLSTGVHLDGTKGSGKTLLAKTISHLGQSMGLSTIIVNQPHVGDNFNQFIQSIS